MLKPSEKATIARELSRFFQTYQSTKSIEPAAQVYFVEDSSEYSMEAIMEAIKRFRKGLVPDRNPDFAPSVAAFVAEVRAQQDIINSRDFWEKTDFLVFESPEWFGICEARGIGSMPRVEYRGADKALHGELGWYCTKEDVALAAPLIAKHRQLLLAASPQAIKPRLRKA